MDEKITSEKKTKITKAHERARNKKDLVNYPWLIKTRDKIRELKNNGKGRFQNFDEVMWYLIERHEKLIKLENRELGFSNLTKKEEYELARKTLLNSMTKEERKIFYIEDAKITKKEFDELK